MATPYLRIGARGSPLALAQAAQARAGLADAGLDPDDVAITVIRTTGDQIVERPRGGGGGKGGVTKEHGAALERGTEDLGGA